MARTKNSNLHAAARAKKDEFYTQIEDIENELGHDEYWEFFRGKTILCNCDDPYESEFFKYFAMNFNALGLKKLIVTNYSGSPISGAELVLPGFEEFYAKPRNEIACKIIIPELRDWNGDGREDLEDIRHYILNHGGCWERLKGDGNFLAGDFRSAECIEFLREADVVVTNPPFSLFREYVAQLMKFNKKFAIIGPFNAITYKEIFPLIKNNQIWLGYGFNKGNAYLSLPRGNYKDFADGVYNPETGLVKFRNMTWFTNIPLKKYKEELVLDFEYSPELYPHYDNYDAIEVSKTARIPKDYFGVMGVPITFLDKYNPEQFEIIWTSDRGGDGEIEWLKKPHDRYDAPVIGGKGVYKRIFIRRRV
ncbi:MAG: adenine-specific methyltransferase EcoRI family protein [Selenomonadaceae bacterium]|nr:adenine-specific methyltransferase EcoRI family protein [Selenomonadaceae bacterium]